MVVDMMFVVMMMSFGEGRKETGRSERGVVWIRAGFLRWELSSFVWVCIEVSRVWVGGWEKGEKVELVVVVVFGLIDSPPSFLPVPSFPHSSSRKRDPPLSP